MFRRAMRVWGGGEGVGFSKGWIVVVSKVPCLSYAVCTCMGPGHVFIADNTRGVGWGGRGELVYIWKEKKLGAAQMRRIIRSSAR